MSNDMMRQAAIPRQQAYGINRRRVGDVVVTMINDGYEDFSFDILLNFDSETAEELLRAANLAPVPRMPVNVYVVQDGQRTVLIDAGDGNFQGNGGRLHAALSAAHIDAAQIDTILLTHAHPDHIGGLASPSASALFPNAELVLNTKELHFWRDDPNVQNTEYLRGPRALALNVFNAYRSRLRTAEDGEVLPGIVMQPLPGHTPGHSGYLISSRNESVLIWGDIVHWPDIQIPRFDASLSFDSDPNKAAETRKRVLDLVANDNILVGGMHLNFPGFIRVDRDGETYAVRDERWSPDLR
jgi:glyoxylase-like metal-dependent hydrolase (beta-lactamase superfamily II)